MQSRTMQRYNAYIQDKSSFVGTNSLLVRRGREGKADDIYFWLRSLRVADQTATRLCAWTCSSAKYPGIRKKPADLVRIESKDL